MNRSSPRATWFLACWIVSCGLHAAYGTRAAACSRLSCFDPVRTFGPDARVPGNLVRFEISAQSSATELSLSLATVDGVELALQEHVGDSQRMFEPVESIAPGTELELRYSYTCGAATPQVYRFTTSEVVDLTIASPTLSLFEEGTSSSGDYAYKSFRYGLPVAPSTKHLLDHEVTLDGKPLRDLEDWEPLADGTVSVKVSCDGTISEDSCGNVYVVEEGWHWLRIATRVVGEDMQPDAIALRVNVECDAGLCSVRRVGSAGGGHALAYGLVLAGFLVALRSRTARRSRAI
jgi:hypothetical protein